MKGERGEEKRVEGERGEEESEGEREERKVEDCAIERVMSKSAMYNEAYCWLQAHQTVQSPPCVAPSLTAPTRRPACPDRCWSSPW